MTRTKKKRDRIANFRCPCCDYKTLTEWGGGEVCPVCFWECDGTEVSTRDEPSAANDGLTLREARRNFQTFGACNAQWIAKVCSKEERDKFEHRSQEKVVNVLDAVHVLRQAEVPISHEASFCEQCAQSDADHVERSHPHDGGLIVYKLETLGGAGPIIACASRGTGKIDEFTNDVIKILAASGLTVECGPVSNCGEFFLSGYVCKMLEFKAPQKQKRPRRQ